MHFNGTLLQNCSHMKKSIYLLMMLIGTSTLQAQNLVTDLRPGLDGSEPALENAFQKGNELFFLANPDGLGNRLYKTDGTSANTVLLEGGSNLMISMILGVMNNEVYYIAGNFLGGENFKLYKTNGTPGNGSLVADYHQGNDFFIAYNMTITMNNVMYFLGNDGQTGFELWRTDGTEAGTYLVKDINPGSESCILLTNVKQYFTQLNGYIYFGAAEPVNGAELWKSDGTEAGTTMVANIDPTAPAIPNMGSNPAFFCTYNNAVYFSAFRTVDGRELWKTDGTEAGTVLVKDIAAGDGAPSGLIVHNGSLYFSAYHPNDNYTLYKSNGTTAGTNVVKAPASGGPTTNSDATFHIFKGKLFFEATSSDGFYRIWYSDGTAVGTMSLPSSPDVFTDYPNSLFPTTNYLYFISGDGNNPGIYRTTEVSNQMTRLTDENVEFNSSKPLFLINSCIVASADNGSTGYELYTVCNQNTQPLSVDENSTIAYELFPNPCSNKVVISAQTENFEVETICLIGLNGQRIPCDFNVINQNTIEINGLETITNGAYFVSIQLKNGQVNQLKLMKN